MSTSTVGSKPARSSAMRMIGWLAVASMLAVALLGPSAGSALGASVAPIALPNDVITKGNPTCSDAAVPYGDSQDWIEFKLQDNTDQGGSNDLQDGTYVVDDMGTADTADDLWIKISNFTNSSSGTPGSFDWESNFGIDSVLVKAGSDKHNLYVYAPTAASAESTGDTGLGPQAGQGNGISHISFCYDADNPPESEPPSNPPSNPPSEPPSNPPSEPPSNPPSEPPSNPPSEPPSNPPSEPPSNPPSNPPSEPPSTEPSTPPSGSEEPSQSEAPSPSFSGGVNPITGAPPTLPPTDGIAAAAQPGSDTWRVLLIVMAALLASIMVLTPNRSSVRR